MIRFADPQDTALLMAITRAAFAESATTPYPSSALGETWEHAAAAIDAGVLLQMRGPDTVGACRFRITGSTLSFTRLCVLPAMRRMGYASRLLDAVEAHAARSSCVRVECSARSAYPDNRAFYQRRGYEVVSYEDVHGVENLRTNLRLRLER